VGGRGIRGTWNEKEGLEAQVSAAGTCLHVVALQLTIKEGPDAVPASRIAQSSMNKDRQEYR
jgi:hypothetical protein